MDLPSDSDESDVDFVPDCEEVVSEAESEEADKETEAQYEDEVQKKKLKRKAQSSKKQTKKKAKLQDEEESPSKCEIKKPVDPEKEKKYEDDLWASFLDTPTPSKSSAAEPKSETKEIVKPQIPSSTVSSNKVLSAPDVNKTKLDDLFTIKKSDSENEFEIQKPVTKLGNSSVVSSLSVSNIPGPRRSGGGLASVLNKIGKKDKISTLEKTKLDWMSFKKEEGIEEDISIHNRGRDGYLERQDFLQRTDLNQFEIEKNLRTNKRSSR